MYPEHQALLQQKTDTDFEAGTLTLQTVLVELNKQSKGRIAAEIVQPINAMEELNALKENKVHWKPERQEEDRKSNAKEKQGANPGFGKGFGDSKPVLKEREQVAPKCWFCQSTNHLRYSCPRYEQWKSSIRQGSQRERIKRRNPDQS